MDAATAWRPTFKTAATSPAKRAATNRAFGLDALIFAYRELWLALDAAKAALQVSSGMMREGSLLSKPVDTCGSAGSCHSNALSG